MTTILASDNQWFDKKVPFSPEGSQLEIDNPAHPMFVNPKAQSLYPEALALIAQTAVHVPVALPQGMEFQTWVPSIRQPVAPGLGNYGLVLAAYHFLGIFRSRSFGGLYILLDGEPVHRSFVIPKYFRYTFMGRNDLQIGLTWTDPRYRGAGLATAALRKLVATHLHPDRKLWYIVYSDNLPSIAVSTRAGFVEVGRIRRVHPLGLSPLSRYELQQP